MLLMLTKNAFIWSKIQKKINIVKYYNLEITVIFLFYFYAKLNFQQSLLHSSVSRGLSDVIRYADLVETVIHFWTAFIWNRSPNVFTRVFMKYSYIYTWNTDVITYRVFFNVLLLFFCIPEQYHLNNAGFAFGTSVGLSHPQSNLSIPGLALNKYNSLKAVGNVTTRTSTLHSQMLNYFMLCWMP